MDQVLKAHELYKRLPSGARDDGGNAYLDPGLELRSAQAEHGALKHRTR